MSRSDGGFHVLAKPTGAVCNLDCSYCFFLSKDRLYPGSSFRMSEETLDRYVRQLIDAQPGPEVAIAWQGGEPTLMGLEFYRRSVEIAKQYLPPNKRAQFSMQTNGVLIDDEWAAFLKENDFLVGVSVDGPRDVHDKYRVNKAGSGTFEAVMKGWAALQRHEVDVNVLCALHQANVGRPVKLYKFFRDEMEARFLQFIPIVERATANLLPLANQGWHTEPGGDRPLYQQFGDCATDRSVTAEQYGRFLVAVFEEWVRRDVGAVFVQMFDVTLGAYFGQYSLCVHAPTCGDAVALEHTGDLYSCDHFVEPEYLLGNISESPIGDLIHLESQQRFGRDKEDTLPQYCRDCDVRFACHGGCPKDRFIDTPDGEPGLNYLCAGYKVFFRHVDQPMRFMADQIRARRSAAEIMSVYSRQDSKRNRHDPCTCASGREFKNCHGTVQSGRSTPPRRS